MASKMSVRWAFNISKWIPTEDQMLLLSSFIQREEMERISRFVFADDAKSTLIGRLLIRKFVHLSTSIPYNKILLGRDERGKPYLLGAGETPISFNVSHHGEYVVLAGNTGSNIGVDVMTIESPNNKNLPEYFRLMKRQFSGHEWNQIRRFQSEYDQLACFYRLWSLKESYVKNLGLGITVPLEQISFAIKSQLGPGLVVTDTKLYERGVYKYDWIFEETLLDERHTVAVAIQVKEGEQYEPQQYQFLQFKELIKEAQAIHECDPGFTSNFMMKAPKPH